MKNGSNHYTVQVCTANLGARPDSEGDEVLKHCFLKVLDQDARVVETLAFGPSGISPEPYPDLASVKCAVQAEAVSADDIQRLFSRFAECESGGYSWTNNNCCSCVREAVEGGLGMRADELIRSAASTIEKSANPFS